MARSVNETHEINSPDQNNAGVLGEKEAVERVVSDFICLSGSACAANAVFFAHSTLMTRRTCSAPKQLKGEFVLRHTYMQPL